MTTVHHLYLTARQRLFAHYFAVHNETYEQWAQNDSGVCIIILLSNFFTIFVFNLSSYCIMNVSSKSHKNQADENENALSELFLTNCWTLLVQIPPQEIRSYREKLFLPST